MGKKLTADQLQLYKGIDDILWKYWDPIGVSPHGPRDEYHTYLLQVFSKRQSNYMVDDGQPQAQLRQADLHLPGFDF
jgi:hypothetical protein